MFRRHKCDDRYEEGYIKGITEHIKTIDPKKPHIVTIDVSTAGQFNDIVEKLQNVIKPKNNIIYTNGNMVSVREQHDGK